MATISCGHCDLDFEEAFADGDEGCGMKCPKCGQKGILSINLVPDYYEDE